MNNALAINEAAILVGEELALMIEPLKLTGFPPQAGMPSSPQRMSANANAKPFGLALAQLLLLVAGQRETDLPIEALVDSHRRNVERAKGETEGEELEWRVGEGASGLWLVINEHGYGDSVVLTALSLKVAVDIANALNFYDAGMAVCEEARRRIVGDGLSIVAGEALALGTRIGDDGKVVQGD